MATAQTTENARCFYVTYSPRGFANELAAAAFATKAEADEFRAETDNNPNQWTLPTSSLSHRAAVKDLQEEARLERMTPAALYQAKKAGDI